MIVMSTDTNTMARPRHCTEAELAKVGVRLIDRPNVRLACQGCGQQWSPMLGRDGRMPLGTGDALDAATLRFEVPNP
jgi:hypothetical protein